MVTALVVTIFDIMTDFNMDEKDRKTGWLTPASLSAEDRLKKSQEIAHLGSWELDVVNNILTWSDEVYRIFGLQPREFGATYEAFLEAVHPDDRAAVDAAYSGSLRKGRDTYEIEHRVVRKSSGEIRYVHEKCEHVRDAAGRIIRSVGMVHDITGRKKAEEELRNALKESQRREAEILALQKSSNAVLKYRNFEDATRTIFDSCKNLIGAAAGYVALLSEDKKENKVLFLDPGGLSCKVDPFLPMPIRGLREEAYSTGKAVYHNDFSGSEWKRFMPEGHVSLDNVLFSPLVIEREVVGLLGLANKPGGFTENDALMAAAFGELAAIALLNSQTLEALRNNEERFRSVVETATDAIITINAHGNIVSWNRAAEYIFGYLYDEVNGRPLALLMPERFREFHQRGINRLQSGGEAILIGKTLELAGLRRNGEEFPLELSLAEWKTKQGDFFTGIVRDITQRKRMEDELQRAKDGLEIKVQERTEELKSAVALLQAEIAERKEAERTIMFYQEQLRALISKVSVLEERERKRISEHLHDNISQNLAISKLRLETLKESYPAIARDLNETQGLIEQTITFVRSMIFDLSPPVLYELGFMSAVDWLVEKLQEQYKIIITFGCDKSLAEPKGEAGILLFKTVRELMMNIVKHSEAEKAKVSISHDGNNMEINIEDNGVGFDTSKIDPLTCKSENFGIFSIREKIKYLKGAFDIESKPGEGTKVKIVVPLG
ncbi:MAG: PAS domain S-box protein [Nitrospirae bacterium]|nr:PAS domain S-box protein [Nitrospirota bacterium]